MRRTNSGYLRACDQTIQNDALMLWFFKISRMRGVYALLGPSSKVRDNILSGIFIAPTDTWTL